MRDAKAPAYNDEDKINFGRYNGEKLEDVPASYLHWWYHNTDCRGNLQLKNYIENSFNALKKETPDLIWVMKKD